MFLDKKTWFKIWLNPGLNLTIFQGTGMGPSHGKSSEKQREKGFLAVDGFWKD